MPGGKFALIIFLLALAWQIVSRVLQAAAKKQEQLRLQDLARRRATGEVLPPSAPPQAPRTQPLNEQERRAAARRAQIEALRARQRGATQPGTQPAGPARQVQVRTGAQAARPIKQRPTVPKAPPTAPGRGTGIRTLDAGFASLRERQAAEERMREAARRQRDEDERQVVALEQAEESERLRRDKRERQDRQRQAKAAAAEAPQSRQTQETSLVTARTQHLRRQLRSTATLRQLFVIKELIDPPLALREDRL